MRIYFDTCGLQRPLDDQTQLRIRVETEAVFSLLAAVEAGDLSLLGSEALEYEVSCIPDQARQTEVLGVLSLTVERLEVTDQVESLALSFEQQGVQAMDAIHLACASIAKADFSALATTSY